MSFIEIVDRVIELLRARGRISYRVLKREFALDDEQIEDLKEELIYAKRLAVDEEGRVLVWTGEGQTPASALTSTPPQPQPQSPASYTPQHLAERILAEQAAMESRGSADGERKTITMWQSQPIKP